MRLAQGAQGRAESEEEMICLIVTALVLIVALVRWLVWMARPWDDVAEYNKWKKQKEQQNG